MVNWTLTAATAATALFSLAIEAKPHRHLHLKRATASSYTLVYSNVKRVPDFDDCIDYTTLEVSGNYSNVAKECANTADAPTTGAKFFAVYQTIDQKGSSEWWCGWWESAIGDMADVIETYQEDGNEIYKAYGYNFSTSGASKSSSSVKGSATSSSASIKGGTSTSASAKGSTSTSVSVKGGSSASASGKGTTSAIVSTTTKSVVSSKPDSTSLAKSSNSPSSSSSSAAADPKSLSTTLKISSTPSSGSSPSASSASSAGSTSSSTFSSGNGSFSASSTGGNSSSTHTKTKSKTSSGSVTSSGAGTTLSTSSTATDLSATPVTLAKKVSSTGSASSSTGKVSSSSGKVTSTIPSSTATSKTGASASGSQTNGKLSTPVSQAAPTGATTVTYVPTATGIAGFSFVTGAVDVIPSNNIVNYWISDSNLNSQNPQVSCANHCSSDSSCKSFAVWAQQTWFNCAIYSVATTTSILKANNMSTLDDGSISSAIIFNKGKDTNASFKYSFENPKCGMKGYLWYEDAFPDNSLDDIDDIVTCANYCKSQSGCLTYEWQPSIQRCQTWNKDMFAAGYLTYDATSTTFWYDSKCDLSKALSPTFRNTRLTADQKAKYCGIKGSYNSAASVNTYKVNSVATADDCGKWCHVYPVFNSYRWSTVDGSCICQAPGVGMAVVANSSATDVHYAMDCYSKMYYLYTDMTVL
ncbi:hypothetical protein TWF718_003882 [Orbilia javanica]|uniref:Apple domain-containing protein n=1 Tax=Orbilia javanica TaxID=47235 RepID=A0AAN8REL1_9PEZI